MNDEKLKSFLKSLSPRGPSAGPENALLEKAAKTARSMKATRNRRMLALATATACVVAVVVAVFLLAGRDAPSTKQPRAVPVAEKPAPEEIDIYEKQLEAEIALIETKISRLKMMARLSPNKTQHLATINALEKELKEISGKPAKDKKEDKKKNGKTSAPETEGERYV